MDLHTGLLVRSVHPCQAVVLQQTYITKHNNKVITRRNTYVIKSFKHTYARARARINNTIASYYSHNTYPTRLWDFTLDELFQTHGL